jgi:hypothetical protein
VYSGQALPVGPLDADAGDAVARGVIVGVGGLDDIDQLADDRGCGRAGDAAQGRLLGPQGFDEFDVLVHWMTLSWFRAGAGCPKARR